MQNGYPFFSTAKISEDLFWTTKNRCSWWVKMKISSNHQQREENSVNSCNAELFQKLFVCHKKIAYCLVEFRYLLKTYMFKIHSFIRCSTRLLHLRPGYEKGKKYLKESRSRVGANQTTSIDICGSLCRNTFFSWNWRPADTMSKLCQSPKFTHFLMIFH